MIKETLIIPHYFGHQNHFVQNQKYLYFFRNHKNISNIVLLFIYLFYTMTRPIKIKTQNMKKLDIFVRNNIRLLNY